MHTSLLTTEEIARHLHISQRTVKRLVAAERIPHLRFGRSVRFDLSEVVRDGRVRDYDHQR